MSNKEDLRIVLKKVGKIPKIMNIENTLEAKQELVGGLIEVVGGLPNKILLVCNEEGKLDNLLPNLMFDFDYIAGDCFFIGDDRDNGNFKSLTDEQINEVYDICNTREIINFFELEDSNGKEFE